MSIRARMVRLLAEATEEDRLNDLLVQQAKAALAVIEKYVPDGLDIDLQVGNVDVVNFPKAYSVPVRANNRSAFEIQYEPEPDDGFEWRAGWVAPDWWYHPRTGKPEPFPRHLLPENYHTRTPPRARDIERLVREVEPEVLVAVLNAPLSDSGLTPVAPSKPIR